MASAWRVAIERELTRAVYVRAMFETGRDAANRAVFEAEPAEAPDLVGVAPRGAKKDVDRATKGLRLHRVSRSRSDRCASGAIIRFISAEPLL